MCNLLDPTKSPESDTKAWLHEHLPWRLGCLMGPLSKTPAPLHCPNRKFWPSTGHCCQREECSEAWGHCVWWKPHARQPGLTNLKRWPTKHFLITCQMRVIWFYIKCPASSSTFCSSSARPQLQALDRSVLCRTRRTSTASAWSQCSPPDINRELQIRVFPAGPRPQKTLWRYTR